MYGGDVGNAEGMAPLLRLPLRAAWIATAPTRFAVKTMLRFLRDDAPEASVAEAPAPHYEQRAAAQAQRRATRPKPTRSERADRITRREPTKGEAAAIRERARDEEWGPGGPGPEIQMDPRLRQP